MRILAIAGSPRRKGNTDILLDRAIEGALSGGGDVERVALRSLHIAPCIHCDGCLADGHCVVNDDMQTLYPGLRQADRLMIASPVYFMGLAAQTKAMIDRCQALWAIKYVLKQAVALNVGPGRKGLFISVGGTGFSRLFEPSLATIKSFFTVLDMELAGQVTYARIDEKGAIRQHPTALDEAYEAGRKLVRPD